MSKNSLFGKLNQILGTSGSLNHLAGRFTAPAESVPSYSVMKDILGPYSAVSQTRTKHPLQD